MDSVQCRAFGYVIIIVYLKTKSSKLKAMNVYVNKVKQ
jgi:hypothetical protein